jgi:hypothetical protein
MLGFVDADEGVATLIPLGLAMTGLRENAANGPVLYLAFLFCNAIKLRAPPVKAAIPAPIVPEERTCVNFRGYRSEAAERYAHRRDCCRIGFPEAVSVLQLRTTSAPAATEPTS